eukprot:TRINITY_DN10523_c0_g1_i1.p1 TRINITY_DN10523_c0_g1~~TRINITY_DN10523_c0_g1_i1.p1  ORF type:complete len:360 (-),score=71.78 TRINITY_DN10523_c0_g1_i1:205-1284(-)
MVVNILKNSSYPNKPLHCSFFAVYDGLNGSRCADFLCRNLHHLVIKQLAILQPPADALKQAIDDAERLYLEMCRAKERASSSASSATVLLVVEDHCYVASVGTTRAVLSLYFVLDTYRNGGVEIKDLIAEGEMKGKLRERKQEGIARRGQGNGLELEREAELNKTANEKFWIFGNARDKLKMELNTSSVKTDITSFKITRQHDFIAITCAGVLEHLSSKVIARSIWTSIHKKKGADTHEQCGMAVDAVLKNTLLYRSPHNVTAVVVSFRNFKSSSFGREAENSGESEGRKANSKKDYKRIMGQLTGAKGSLGEMEFRRAVQITANKFTDKVLLKSTKRGRMEELREQKPIIVGVKSFNI